MFCQTLADQHRVTCHILGLKAPDPKISHCFKDIADLKNKLHLHCSDVGDISVLTISLEMSAVIISKDYCSTPCYVTHYAVCMSGLMLIFALAMA